VQGCWRGCYEGEGVVKVPNNFWSRVDRSGECWVWTGAKNEKGYGVVGVPGEHRTTKAHRMAWEIYNGPLPPGQCVLHRCDNPACCRPSHLFLGSRADNNADMCLKGRHRSGSSKTPADACKYRRGERHHGSKLTVAIVTAIRSRVVEVWQAAVCREYELQAPLVHKIATRKLWKHV
jgi:hypothetical protein